MTRELDRVVGGLGPPSIHLMAGDRRDAGAAESYLSYRGVTVRVLRGRKMTGETGLFDEIAAALQFPHYFGESWDAVEECLDDLDQWLGPIAALLVIVDDADLLLASPDAEDAHERRGEDALTVALSIVAEAGRRWALGRTVVGGQGRPPTPFHLLLMADAGSIPTLVDRVAATGTAFDVVRSMT